MRSHIYDIHQPKPQKPLRLCSLAALREINLELSVHCVIQFNYPASKLMSSHQV